MKTGTELILQGYSRSVYGLYFHRDGSLATSCGLDVIARVWDLQMGKVSGLGRPCQANSVVLASLPMAII